MPRDGNGNYNLPAGNPVVTNTLITSTWANDTVGDLALEMQDSLSRSGKGALDAPLGIVDGTGGGVPGLSFQTQPTSGLRMASVGDVRVQIAGQDNIRFLAVNRATDVWNNDLTIPAWERVFTTPTANVLDGNVEKTVQSKRETVAGVVPATLAEGELAANIADSPPRLYIGTAGGASVVPFGEFPSGTKLPFYQDVAPAYWTIDQTVDEHTVRITKGLAAGGVTGGTSGGTYNFSTLFANLAEGATPGVGDHTLTAAQSGVPAHPHTTVAHRHRLLTGWTGGSGQSHNRVLLNLQTSTGNTPVYTDVSFTSALIENSQPAVNNNTAADASAAHGHTVDLRAKWAACIVCSKD